MAVSMEECCQSLGSPLSIHRWYSTIELAASVTPALRAGEKSTSMSFREYPDVPIATAARVMLRRSTNTSPRSRSSTSASRVA